MTKEEAIICLKGIKNYGRDTFTEQSDWQNSLDMAIEALEQQSDDCVSRADLLKIYEDRFIELQKVHQQDKQLGINWCINKLRDMPPVTPTQRWISVSERLPESNRLVVCYITTGATETYFLALWNDIQKEWEEGIGGYRLLERDLGYKVIAWKPLPKPYEEK